MLDERWSGLGCSAAKVSAVVAARGDVNRVLARLEHETFTPPPLYS